MINIFYKKFTVYILLITLCLSLSACNSGGVSMAPPERTYIIYMNGSDLESNYGAATADINEMLAADIRSDIKIYILTGGTKIWHNDKVNSSVNEIFTVENKSLSKMKEMPADNMGDAATLSDFIIWAMNESKTSEYHLIMWNHGGNAITGFGKDEKHEEATLLLTELSNALKTVYDTTGKKLDTIAFDACLMASIETACAVSDYASFMVASQDIISVDGFDYKSFFDAEKKALGSKSSVALLLAESYIASQKSNRSGFVTACVIDLSKIASVKSAFEEAAVYLNEAEIYNSAYLTLYGGLTKYEGYSNMADMLSIFEAFNLAQTEEFKNLESAVSSAVIYCENSKYRISSCGLSVYYPAYVSPAITYEALLYSSLGFSDIYSDIVTSKAGKALLEYEESTLNNISFNIEGVTYDGTYLGEDLFNLYYSAVFYSDDETVKTYRIKKSRFADEATISAIFISTVTSTGKSSEKYLLK